jgi:cysteine synthase A
MFPDRGVEVLAKLEQLNPSGSVKDRPARHMIEDLLRRGVIGAGGRIVESSSGNFGIALAMVCRIHRLAVTIVVDPCITPTNLTLLKRYGADVQVVTTPDPGDGGYLNSRLARVRQILADDPRAVWVNQYANNENWRSHATTAREILDDVEGPIDWLVAAVSTTGTLHGLTRELRVAHPRMRVLAVDVVGSIIFGGTPARRRIPGIGASRVPELLTVGEIDRICLVDDDRAIRGCRDLLSTEAILAGASSGAVVSAVRELVTTFDGPARVVTLLPDRGERYLDLVYGDEVQPAVEEATR